MSNNQSGAWRRYNIFISSTFKDMDFERDVIKFKVIPALNRRFRDRRVELQAIDLRLGVNTSKMSEEESERKVLSVCTSCIDSARPFFIGLIGRRYGWIPPLERWKEFMAGLSDEEREILAGTAGCSVTEMEIVYGALSQGSFDSSHVLFYLRDDASYDGMPEDVKPIFCDSDPENIKKLDTLKAKVKDIFGARGGEDDRCTPYHLTWQDGGFSSEEFERIVEEQLAQQIEAETAREEEEGADTWWAQEKELEESTLLRLLPGSIELDVYDDEEEIPDQVGDDEEEEDDDEEYDEEDDEEYEDEDEEYDEDEEDEDDDDDESADIAIWYVQGFGASTYMAQDYAQWDEETDVIRLLGVFGLSEYSTSMRPVIARWIHEVAEKIGYEDLPDDDQLLGKMPQNELYELFEKIIDEAAEDYYIYIYLDDVESLEMTSPKDLYMTWLDHVKDNVNIMVNLQDDSEARDKFFQQHTYLSKKMMLGVEGDPEAAKALIENYEQTYFLELPEKIKKQMLKNAESGAKSKKTIAPLKIHNVFRIFESLTQEDFREIRGQKGSQIDAINGYLEKIWKDMPNSPYDVMTFMVNTIVKNLGLGENMRQAIWTIAASPSGLRESDIAHFAGEDWDVIQFYRAMNFLHDFFYEDRARHLWRAKYITLPEDGLAERQKAISEYILTLDPNDSLRESMGLYFAIGGLEPSHFAHYMVEGDYLHGQQQEDITRQQGPQVRQLMREGFLDSKDFENYAKALPVEQRLQLIMDILVAMADLKEEREAMHKKTALWFADANPENLSAVDAFTFASIVAGNHGSEKALEMSLAAARRCKEADFPGSDRLISMAASLLIMAYQKHGKTDKAEALRQEITQGGRQSARDRFTALTALIAQAGARSKLISKAKKKELIDKFFEEYYAIVDSLEMNQENFTARFKSGDTMLQAFFVLYNEGRYDKLIEEIVRFLPSMRLFYKASNFTSWPDALNLFLYVHMMLAMSTGEWLTQNGSSSDRDHPFQEIKTLALIMTAQGAELLKDADPDNQLIGMVRANLGNMLERTNEAREDLFSDGTELADVDQLIEKRYEEYVSQKN
ncbi:MAG: DUF4062 domain-containing protein [Bacteroidales bacterium]|nr:DUF4062 domain-containing protein [Bacteroidales bacterium]